MGNIYLKKLVELQETPVGRTPLQSIIPLAAGLDAVVTGASGYSIQLYGMSFQAEADAIPVVVDILDGATAMWSREIDKKTMLDAEIDQQKAPWKLGVGNDLALQKDNAVLKDVKVTVLYDLIPIA
jgi:hypothetical protein